MKPKGKFAAKILCSAMTLAMAGALLPVSAAAQDIQTLNDTDTGMYVSKTATLEDDGTYTINLEAYATGETVTTVTQKPTDVVLVLDVSGSMADNFTYEVGQEYEEDFSTKITDLPNTVRYHLCPDGTYNQVRWEVSWEWDGLLRVHRYRYICDHCKATRKWDSPVGKDLGDTRDDPWNLYELKTVTKTENKLAALQAAAKGFVDAVEEKNAAIEDESQKHQVSIVKFAGNSTSKVGNDMYYDPYLYNYTQIVNRMTPVDESGATTLKNSIDALTAAGATSVDYGMTHAESLLQDTPDDRNKIVVVFTDGEPTHSNSFSGTVANDAIKTAKALKADGAKIYTIGVFSNANPNDTSTSTNAYMNALSSNYPNATSYNNLGTGKNDGYYKTVTASEDLSKIFEEISESVGKTEVQLDDKSVIKDIMGDGFVLKNGVSKVEVSEVPYSGRDNHGNRVFGEPISITDDMKVDVDYATNTVKVSGFDFSKKYLLDGDKPENEFTAAKQGSKLVIRITGVEATDDAIRNTEVYTNNEKSGIYANADSQEPDIVFPNCTTKLTSTSYVLDYGKSFNATANDPENGWDASQVTSLQNSMDRITNTANASVDLKNGKADKKDNTTVTYTPQTMSWNGYDSFYAFGKVSDGTMVSTGANQWSKINVIPANNVYYEDDFITNIASGTVGIEYSGNWNMVGTTGNNDETANGDVQGWETSLADDTTYSDGSAHEADAGATATFTFTGTGVDIYSRTDMNTGMVNAKLYRGDNTTAAADMIKFYTVDNKSKSGTYYQIPTLHFENLEQGTYTVKITVQTTSDGRSTYCLDGVRVYNPLSNEQETDETVQNAYGNEVNAVFQTVRDLLITSAGDSDTFGGPVFIDKIDDATGVKTNTVADYVSKGPKNEVYLAEGQSIVFAVEDPNLTYHIGLKAPNGETSAEISNGSGKNPVTVSAASDLYYTVVPTVMPNESGMIEIRNTGAGLLSVTKLRISGEPAVSEMSFLRTFSLEEALNYANSFDALPVSEETQEPMEPDAEESVEPEQPEATVEPEQPEENTGDVVIENPEPVQPEQPVVNQTGSILSKLFGGLRNLFRW